jgi:glycosyltransferase involved in cell wall biosynthesis
LSERGQPEAGGGVRVLFDFSAVQPAMGKFHGAAEYTRALFEQLLLLRKDEVILGFYNPGKWLDPVLESAIQKAGGRLFAVTTKRELQALVDRGECDKVYSASPYGYYDMDFSEVDFVFTIHGLRAIEMPTDRYELIYNRSFLSVLKYVYKNVNRQRYINRNKALFAKLLSVKSGRKTVVVDSYHTKYALLSHFPSLEHGQIKVLYGPRKHITILDRDKMGARVLAQFDVSARQYFLLISGNRWTKNAFRAVRALDEIFSDYPEIDKRVLILGVDKPVTFARHIKNRDRFAFAGYVDELELELLYQNAYVFLYPTLNEGFGYPPLESMKHGTPVICSAITSTTEVCGDAVLYFNPFSVDEMKNRILLVLFEDGIWERYSQLGIERSCLIAAKQDSMSNELCRMILAP